ncbi:glycoprotein 2-beta-D-xylosyltransferase [Ranunculus cassubicifolius]
MNRQRKGFLLKFLVFLFALNTISLFFYFSSLFIHHPPSTNNHPTQIPLHTKNNNNIYFRGKPWPILPSYLPWTPLNPNIPSKSCEAYFGNGFNRRIDLLPSSSSSSLDGWFRCFYSESLQSSICEGGRMRMDTDKIKMSMGGEKLESVIGRSEEDELPIFDFGAFQIQHHNGNRKNKLVNDQFLDQFVPNGRIHMHTMRSLIDSVQLVASDQFNCSQWVEEPTLLVTRFEYANLFHTVTDWYSAYVSSRVTGLPNRPHLVFVDGHCKTPLEETWEALFSSVRYAKNFSGSVCFRHAILSPLGYETALFQGLSEAINCEGTTAHELWEHPDNSKTARLSEFGEMIRAAFGYPVDRNRGVPKPVSSGVYNILFVRREDYLAHPRHGGKVESRLTNEQQVFDALKTWLSDSKNVKCKTNLVNGLFAHMSMKEQVRAIQDASIIIGAHGAGLTHIVSATPNTVILEIISSLFRRPHFALISQWKGLKYHAINLQGSYAEPQTVIDQLSSILKNLGC